MSSCKNYWNVTPDLLPTTPPSGESFWVVNNKGSLRRVNRGHCALPDSKDVKIHSKGKYAVLIHDLGGNKWSLYALGQYLAGETYKSCGECWKYDAVFIYEYNSYGYDLAALANIFYQQVNVLFECRHNLCVDVFAHGLGGLITRQAIKFNCLGELVGRAILLGTPNNGLPASVNTLYQANVVAQYPQFGSAPIFPDLVQGSAALNNLNNTQGKYRRCLQLYTFAGTNYYTAFPYPPLGTSGTSGSIGIPGVIELTGIVGLSGTVSLSGTAVAPGPITLTGPVGLSGPASLIGQFNFSFGQVVNEAYIAIGGTPVPNDGLVSVASSNYGGLASDSVFWATNPNGGATFNLDHNALAGFAFLPTPTDPNYAFLGVQTEFARRLDQIFNC